MSRRRSKVCMAPIAVASDGALFVKAGQFTVESDLEAVVGCARASGLEVFVGVIIPDLLRGRVLNDVDDAHAYVVGRLGPQLTASASPESAFSRSAEVRASVRRGRGAGQAPRQRGRRP
jgi:hypothetical protein